MHWSVLSAPGLRGYLLDDWDKLLGERVAYRGSCSTCNGSHDTQGFRQVNRKFGDRSIGVPGQLTWFELSGQINHIVMVRPFKYGSKFKVQSSGHVVSNIPMWTHTHATQFTGLAARECLKWMQTFFSLLDRYVKLAMPCLPHGLLSPRFLYMYRELLRCFPNSEVPMPPCKSS